MCIGCILKKGLDSGDSCCEPSTPVRDFQKACGLVRRWLGKKQTSMFTDNDFAAPSFIWPAGIAENCRKLADEHAGKFAEVGLVFFESEACLAYTDDDLPDPLAELPLRYHVHLPLDLPWDDGREAVERVLSGLVRKAAFLKPCAYVLHPPVELEQMEWAAEIFRQLNVDLGCVMLENTPENSLVAHYDQYVAMGFGVCLDTGHMLKHDQLNILELPDLWKQVKMVHLNAPGEGGRHESLAALDEQGRKRVEHVLTHVESGTTLMVELFSPDPLFESRSIVREILIHAGRFDAREASA